MPLRRALQLPSDPGGLRVPALVLVQQRRRVERQLGLVAALLLDEGDDFQGVVGQLVPRLRREQGVEMGEGAIEVGAQPGEAAETVARRPVSGGGGQQGAVAVPGGVEVPLGEVAFGQQQDGFGGAVSAAARQWGQHEARGPGVAVSLQQQAPPAVDGLASLGLVGVTFGDQAVHRQRPVVPPLPLVELPLLEQRPGTVAWISPRAVGETLVALRRHLVETGGLAAGGEFVERTADVGALLDCEERLQACLRFARPQRYRGQQHRRVQGVAVPAVQGVAQGPDDSRGPPLRLPGSAAVPGSGDLLEVALDEGVVLRLRVEVVEGGAHRFWVAPGRKVLETERPWVGVEPLPVGVAGFRSRLCVQGRPEAEAEQQSARSHGSPSRVSGRAAMSA